MQAVSIIGSVLDSVDQAGRPLSRAPVYGTSRGECGLMVATPSGLQLLPIATVLKDTSAKAARLDSALSAEAQHRVSSIFADLQYEPAGSVNEEDLATYARRANDITLGKSSDALSDSSPVASAISNSLEQRNLPTDGGFDFRTLAGHGEWTPSQFHSIQTTGNSQLVSVLRGLHS